MDADLLLTLGLFLAIPAILTVGSALLSGETPRLGSSLVVLSGFLIALAYYFNGGYQLSQIPDVVLEVIARFM